MDNLEFLDGEPSGDESRADLARDEGGRFAPNAAAEPAPPPEPVIEDAPQEPTTAPVIASESKPEPGHVPISALLDEREKRKEMEARLKAIEARQQPAPYVPDRHNDPDAYDDWLQAQLIGQTRKLTLQFSERMAQQAHGAELFQKAKEWGVAKCDEDPYFNQRLHASDDPFDVVVKEYQQAQALSALSDPGRLQAFLDWQAGSSAAPAQPHQAAQPHPSPPRSLNSAPAAMGAKPGEQPVGEGVAFDSVFRT